MRSPGGRAAIGARQEGGTISCSLVLEKGGAMEVFAKKAARQVGARGGRQQAGGDQAALDDGGFLAGGHVGVAAVEKNEIGRGLDAAVTTVESPAQRRRDHG